MLNYKEEYEYYVLKCEEFGVNPINFYHFILSLSQEQLDAFYERVER